MSTAAAGTVAARQLFTSLLDDAALFPPGNAPMMYALQARRDNAAAAFADLVGPFLCPASRLDELQDTLDDGSELDIVVIMDTGAGGLSEALAAVARDGRLTLCGLEIALRADHDLDSAARRTAAAVLDADLRDGMPIFVEVPRAASTESALDVLAEYDLQAKLRTGGADASAYPTEAEVAAFLVACLDRQVAMKATAGLHHAVRNTAASTGFEQHGYLNLLLAVRAALDGGDVSSVAVELADRDGAAVADRIRAFSSAEASQVRSWFRSFGTCSINEPVDDLVALGLLAGTPA